MKFWQKIFISTLVLFVIAFDFGVYMLVSYSYQFNLQRETDSCVREQSIILSSLQNSIAAAQTIYPNASTDRQRLSGAIEPLAEYYQAAGVSMALYMNEQEVYLDMEQPEDELLVTANTEEVTIKQLETGGKQYLYAASRLPDYDHLTFIYRRDISSLHQYLMQTGQTAVLISTGVCLVLGSIIFILIRRLTRPIRELNQVTSEIAGGAYSHRADIRRKDELGELGQTFNRMADSVEENVEQLTKGAEEKQQFIDNLAHELKTPLTAILGYSEYLQNARSDEQDRIRAAGHLHDAAARMKNLSEKLLDMTYLRITETRVAHIRLSPLFASLEHIVKPMLDAQRLTLEFHLEPEYLAGDETLLLSLLTNLVENAARASKQGDSIQVRAYTDQYSILEVTDHGMGMEPKEIERVTQPFYRVDRSRSREHGGVGLGLSLCRQIAQLHGARLNIKSEHGTGTTVQIIFTTRLQPGDSLPIPADYTE